MNVHVVVAVVLNYDAQGTVHAPVNVNVHVNALCTHRPSLLPIE